jgi:hypothetical protein
MNDPIDEEIDEVLVFNGKLDFERQPSSQEINQELAEFM